ncbi:hypothetical protein F4604DRAFT_1928806 [Suillus subluteus]|nr:hypothetical protein F4604DRAFT_1928806 [Suillus subluteus]
MPATNTPRRTRPSNATTRPGQIVLDAQAKRRTKAQKNADNLALKEAKEAQIQKGLEHMAGLQNEMEQAQEELLTKKVVPVRPKPRARKVTKPVVENGDDHTDSLMDADEAASHQEAVEDMEDEAAGAKKKRAMKKGGKPLIRDAISNMQSKMNKALSKVEGDKAATRVSDGKDTVTPHINASTKKLALGGRVTNWISKVKPETTERTSRPSVDTIPTRAPPTSIFSQGTASTTATSAQIPIRKPVAPTQIPDAEALIGNFADDIDDTLEREATIAQGKGKSKSKVTSIFDDNSDIDEPIAPVTYESDDDLATPFVECRQFSQEPRAPVTQADNPLKQKAHAHEFSDDDEGSMVSDWSMDIEGPDLEDAIMDYDDTPEPEPVVVKKEKVQRTTSLTSVSITTSVTDSKLPAPKKVKVEPSTAHARSAPAVKHQLNVDTMPDHMKSRSSYHNVDLPATMQVDQCWTKQYLPTIMLWAGSYQEIWNIPDEVLLLHAQLIFDAVYKELNINIVQGEFAFLFEDPDKPSPLTAYRSPFILQLLGTAHLNAINGYVDVPKLDTHALATHGMVGVIALSTAAIKRTLNMLADNDLKVKQVLVSGSQGKLAIKLPKVLNKTTGKMMNAPFLFSGVRWTKVTTSFIKSISSKPAGYVDTTIQMAHACTALNDATDTPHGSLDDDGSEDDERAMICK